MSFSLSISFFAEATGRRTSDIGSLLKNSKAAHGVSV